MPQTCECGCGAAVNPKSRFIRGHGQRGLKRTGRRKPERHGMTGKPEYLAWHNMLARCYLKTYRQYDDWGGRGITVCNEWRNSFTAFYEYIGPRPSPKHSLDRIDNDGNYEPGNVHWTTRSAQQVNRRTQSQASWSSHYVAKARIAAGLSREKFAQQTRLSFSAVKRIETKDKFKPGEAEKISAWLHKL